MKFSKKGNLFLFLTDTQLFVLEFFKDSFKIRKDFKIEELISHPELFKEFVSKEIKILIIPDYWITTRFYPIATKKASVIDSFLKRRLPIDFPDVPDCKDFFEYSFQKHEEQQGIQVYLIQERLFYLLYKNVLSSLPYLEYITSPAFVWKAKLSKKIKDINEDLKIFVHTYQNKAYLCFFLESYFLFSRLISIEGDYTTQLSYELMQSFRLVSQKTKREVEKVYFISTRYLATDTKKLSEVLGVKIVDISNQVDLSSPSSEEIEKIGSFAFLKRSDILDSINSFYLSYRPLKELKEWTFFQNTGILVGVFIFLLMLAEAIYLNKIASKFPTDVADNKIFEVQQYLSAIDEILYHKQKPDFSLIIMKLLNCKSKKIYMQHIKISSGPPFSIELTGYVQASDVVDFQKIFSTFLSNIKKTFKYARIPTLRETDVKKVEEGFRFRFIFELNEEQV